MKTDESAGKAVTDVDGAKAGSRDPRLQKNRGSRLHSLAESTIPAISRTVTFRPDVMDDGGTVKSVSRTRKPAKPIEREPLEYDRFEELTRKLVKVPK